ncbi:MAG: prolipoprotein diacylglyceryl transferase [Clostridiales bacterium]|jgi:phosphatidylglycerol:prolipoprotein diacylglycerol transferase|nr:prolipoprotein diacylglyceryl transferase [Clostridiales bacterium]
MINFPFAGISMNISPIAFEAGGVSVRWYGIIIAVAIISGGALALFRARAEGMNGDTVVDALIWMVIAALVGARAYFVLFNLNGYTSFVDVFKVWEGGLAIYGAIIGGATALLIFCRVKKLNFWQFADVCAPAVLLGQAIGRWGNFANREAYGIPTNSWIRMEIIDANGNLASVHPTFLYECVWNLLGIALLYVLNRFGKLRRGETFLTYIAWYGLGRFFIEPLRADSLPYGADFKISQIVALITLIAAVVMFAVNRRHRIFEKSGKK